ncbi:MAG: SPOR domain-containing protein, partial [Gammaproteobacteria bacterium]|nr:SPOR domain-containing protein [Gammaproteobacteria bacterium]
MNGFKQRVLGALVLVSIAVIFLPMMFDEPRDERATQVIEIPATPQVPVMEISRPEMPVQMPEDEVVVEDAGEGWVDEGAVAPVVDAEPVAPAAPAQPVNSQAPVAVTQPAASAPAAKPTPAPVAAAPVRPAAPAPAPAQPAPTPKPAVGAAPPAAPAPTPAPAATPTSGTWMLQVASFGSRENAQRLRDQIAARGYAASTSDFKQGDKTLVRVLCGPFKQRSEAEAAKST